MSGATTPFIGASIVASFLGGMIAFLAPCCVSFLFPSYFATAFKTKSKIFLMTFVYFIGMSSVLVPIGLGFSALARLFSHYHYAVFLLGGVVLIILAVMTIFGISIPMPFKATPNFKNHDIASIFLLGLISGAASSCCTPVLIGVMTMSALSGTFLYAFILSLTYVLGMVFPLFFLSYFWDKYNFSKARWLQGKTFTFKLFNKEHYIHTSHILSASILAGMGILIIILSIFKKTWTSAAYLSVISKSFGKLNSFIIAKSKFMPEYVWIIIVILLLILIIRKVIFTIKQEEK